MIPSEEECASLPELLGKMSARQSRRAIPYAGELTL